MVTWTIKASSLFAPSSSREPATAWGVVSDPLGFSGITSSFITVSTWNLAHLSGHQFGVVSCKYN